RERGSDLLKALNAAAFVVIGLALALTLPLGTDPGLVTSAFLLGQLPAALLQRVALGIALGLFLKVTLTLLLLLLAAMGKQAALLCFLLLLGLSAKADLVCFGGFSGLSFCDALLRSRCCASGLSLLE